jgi:hypothetical protein
MNNYQVKLKMADVNMDKFFLAPGFSDLSAVNSETERECCLKLKQELTETLCELSSAQKIIQLLQEDKKSQHQYNNRSTNEDKMNQVMDFEVITNKTNNRNSQGISTSEWKSYVRGKNYQQQLIPVIINWYAVLGSLHIPHNHNRTNKTTTSSFSVAQQPNSGLG